MPEPNVEVRWELSFRSTSWQSPITAGVFFGTKLVVAKVDVNIMSWGRDQQKPIHIHGYICILIYILVYIYIYH